jgi:hypothetical protein
MAADCTSRMAGRSPDGIEVVAALMRVEVSQVPAILCPRSVDAIASEQLRYEDLEAIREKSLDPAPIRRVFPLLFGPLAPGSEI